jgi:L-aspartate oxidase
MTRRQSTLPASEIVDEHVDFLIIGSGIAGLWAALNLAESGQVLVVTKKDEAESNTNYAQGGIAAVMSQFDAIENHINDTLRVGRGLCNPRVVRRVLTAAPALVRDLIEAGVNFTYKTRPHATRNLDLGLEGGHSAPRVVHAADLTGQEIESALLHGLAVHQNASIWEHHLAIDLIIDQHGDTQRCIGALVFDRHRRLVRRIIAPVTILSTGGGGQVYRHTTNPGIATGDGVAMAFRAGARVANLEFVQFHPTRLCHPRARRFLISEAVRGAGGKLRNRRGEAYMERYHPLRDLAPRDVVARAIVAECKRDHSRCSWLDITHLRPSFIRKRFPNICERCKQLGIDITTDPIPVVPAAHYMCGGVVTDSSAQTDIRGLWAAGEVAHTGLHGANRLASNSLLEAMYLAAAAASSARRSLRALRRQLPSRIPGKRLPMIGPITKSPRGWNALRDTMWENVGIIRERKGLEIALKELARMRKEAEERWWSEGVNAHTIEYRNATMLATLIAKGALERTESRGLQYRLDYPLTDDEHWKRDTIRKGPKP